MRLAYRLVATALACALCLPSGASVADADGPHVTPAPVDLQQGADAFNTQQLDALLAPIALYPDPLLAQVLMASTYPVQVLQAARWLDSSDNRKLSGDALVKALESQSWDPSVKSLVPFPQIIDTMSNGADWMQQLGYAFADQQSDVLDAVQRLRRQAVEAGTLTSNDHFVVSTQPVTVSQTVNVSAPAAAPATAAAASSPPVAAAAPPPLPATAVEGAPEPIVISPTNPDVVYVPTYNPATVYGTWPYAAYPPVVLPPPPGYAVGTALAAGLAFGAGVAVTAGLWNVARPYWGGGWGGNNYVNVNVNRYNNINVNRTQINSSRWQANQANVITGRPLRPPAGPVGQPARAAGLPANAVGRPTVRVPASAVNLPQRAALPTGAQRPTLSGGYQRPDLAQAGAAQRPNLPGAGAADRSNIGQTLQNNRPGQTVQAPKLQTGGGTAPAIDRSKLPALQNRPTPPAGAGTAAAARPQVTQALQNRPATPPAGTGSASTVRPQMTQALQNRPASTTRPAQPASRPAQPAARPAASPARPAALNGISDGRQASNFAARGAQSRQIQRSTPATLPHRGGAGRLERRQ